MIQLPVLEHLDLKLSECLICIMSIGWCYCCKAFAYITALSGVIATKRAMSSTLSRLLTSWNGLGTKWNQWLNFARFFRFFIVFNMTLHRCFCSIFTDFLHHSSWQQVRVRTVRKPLKCIFIWYYVHIPIIISWRVLGVFVRSFIAGIRYNFYTFLNYTFRNFLG